ncbi:nibrin [Bombina bombina]|uniref:nibrin n=1 Tax=Bombina bombina TaxID=8345 RepID=UPI00235B03A4|nr:nibrin [Bombina bombina]
MWKLVPESAGETYHFLTGTDYVVGRKNCVILIPDDQSISRSHAVLSATHTVANLGQPNLIPTLTIKDASKYGTFVNEERIANAVPRALKSGDKVTFGVFNSKYRVEYEPLVVSSSCLENTEKTTLNQVIVLLGGHVLNNWAEKCTHLVMTSIKVTIKTICALVCCRPVVKPEYFSELVQAIKQKQVLPAPKSFIKQRFFLSLQYKKLSPAIIFGGGKAKLITGEREDTLLLENPSTCVIDVGVTSSQLSESVSAQTWISSTLDLLQRKDLRTIPEAEIGLAVIYMSTEIYCNPQRCPPNGNQTETSRKNVIAGATLSQSMAVDETILPAPTLNITAYVANTELQDQTNTWMDISGAREVKETPKTEGRSNYQSSKAQLEKDTGGGDEDIRCALFQDVATTEKKNVQLSQINKSAKNTEKDSQTTHSSNKIKNYFQPLSKKRGRDEEENKFSSTKTARKENVSNLCSEQTQPVMASQAKGKTSQICHASNTGQQSALYSEQEMLSDDQPLGNKVTANSVESITKKRKEIEEDLVEESDVESEEEKNIKMEESSLNSNLSNVKRRRLVSEKDADENFNTSPEKEAKNTILKQIPPQNTKAEGEIKKEQYSQREQSKITTAIKEEDDGIPRRLLLTEFKSLVVSLPARNIKTSANSYQGNATNFKKFKKVAYPGAGGFPHIIGGSDLIAHDRKKNSELEQWLRQEMEEQTQQAREESLAENLFRYNPKSVKRRR